MTTRLLLGAAVLVVAVALAWVLRRRGAATAAPARTAHHVPAQLHRADFPRPEAPWLVVLFSSATCEGCAEMAPKVAALASPDVATAEVEWTADRVLHERYGITGVPLTVVCDADGVTRAHVAGRATATDLWAIVAEVRRPGSTPFDPDRPGADRPG